MGFKILKQYPTLRIYAEYFEVCFLKTNRISDSQFQLPTDYQSHAAARGDSIINDF